MPTNAAFNEAMRHSQQRFQMSDPELREGKVEMITKHRKGTKIEQPWASSGSCAIVYKFRTQSGALRALRGFTRYLDPEMEERYKEIGSYFETHIPTITAGFKYHAQGILIKEDEQQGEIYPLIEMDWIEGKTLLETIDALCQQRDQAGLRSLSLRWLDLVQQLRSAGIAHGDLAGDNVLVRDGQLILVDYDGVYVPALKGRSPVVVGKEGYQHPKRQKQSQVKFDEHMDDFSALLIYTALLALAIEPQLWDVYARHNAEGKIESENLLFEEKDLLDPAHSPLMQALEQLSDPLLTKAVQALKQACLQPIDQVRFLPELLDPDYDKKQALAQLEKAITANDDQAILHAWVKALAQYAPAQVHLPRVQLAQQRQETLLHFHRACASKNPREIIAAYLPLIDNSLTVKELMLVNLARNYVQGFDNTPDALVAAYDAIQQSPYRTALVFTAEEQQRVEQARTYEQAMAAFQRASKNRNAQQIVDSYKALPLNPATYTIGEQRKMVEAAGRYLTMRAELQTALRNNDEQRMAQVYNETLAKQFTDMPADELRRMEQMIIKQRLETLLDQRQYHQALSIAANITDPSGNKISPSLRPRLSEATRDSIKRCNLENLAGRIETRRRANFLIVTWQWPENKLVRDAVIIWSPEEWPEPVQAVQLLDQLGQPYKQVVRRDHVPGLAEIDIGFASSIFLRAYAAMMDEWGQRRLWYFSSGEKSCLQVPIPRPHR